MLRLGAVAGDAGMMRGSEASMQIPPAPIVVDRLSAALGLKGLSARFLGVIDAGWNQIQQRYTVNQNNMAQARTAIPRERIMNLLTGARRHQASHALGLWRLRGNAPQPGRVCALRASAKSLNFAYACAALDIRHSCFVIHSKFGQVIRAQVLGRPDHRSCYQGRAPILRTKEGFRSVRLRLGFFIVGRVALSESGAALGSLKRAALGPGVKAIRHGGETG